MLRKFLTIKRLAHIGWRWRLGSRYCVSRVIQPVNRLAVLAQRHTWRLVAKQLTALLVSGKTNWRKLRGFGMANGPRKPRGYLKLLGYLL
jgi:hypothetical protein